MSAPALAADFYKGKTIKMYIGSGAGGGFDTYGRTVGQFLGKQIPGKPTIQPINRPGAGGRKNANLLYLRDPKDGTGHRSHRTVASAGTALGDSQASSSNRQSSIG